jgi:cell division septal protein FtsQ
MSVKARPEKNFRRASSKATRRKSKKRRISWRAVRIVVSVVLVVYAMYRAFDLVVSASSLQVRHIVVHGNNRMSTKQIEALAAGMRGTSILTADLGAFRRRLLQSPWVAEVALRRVLPSTIEVFVRERRPMGLSRLGTQLYLIDRQGTVIAEFGPQYSQFDLPIIDGLVRTPSADGTAVDEGRAELAARVIDALGHRKPLARRLSQIDVGDPHDAIVMLDGDPAQLHVGEDRFLERLQSYVDLAPALRERVPGIEYVDLRFGERLYVRPGATTRKKPDHNR